MLINPFRNTWVVAKEDFLFRGCKLEMGSVFRPRTLNPRAWKKLIVSGEIVKKEDFVAEPKEVVPEKVVPVEVPTEDPVVEEVQEKKPKKASKKKSTKKKEK